MSSSLALGHSRTLYQRPCALLGWSQQASFDDDWSLHPTFSPNREASPCLHEKAENAQIPSYESGEHMHGEDKTAGHLCLGV